MSGRPRAVGAQPASRYRDAPVVDLCDCNGFTVWYVEGGVHVCHCGHSFREHIGRTCIGWVHDG